MNILEYIDYAIVYKQSQENFDILYKIMLGNKREL